MQSANDVLIAISAAQKPGSPKSVVDHAVKTVAEFKRIVKHNRINLNAASNYFKALLAAFESPYDLESPNALISVTHACLCHLSRRVYLQDPQILAAYAQDVASVLVNFLALKKQTHSFDLNMKALTDLRHAAPQVVEQTILYQGMTHSINQVRVTSVNLLAHWIETGSLPLQTLIFPICKLLKDSNPRVVTAATNLILEMFVNSTPRDMEDLASELKTQNIADNIQSIILRRLKYGSQENSGTIPNAHTVPRLQQNKLKKIANQGNLKKSHSFYRTDGNNLHVLASQCSDASLKNPMIIAILNNPLYLTPEVDISESSSIAAVQSVLTARMHCFEGKETEDNWKPREQMILHLRRYLKCSASQSATETVRFISKYNECVAKSLQSLRTALVQQACYFLRDTFCNLNTDADILIEPSLTHLVRLVSGTKRITAVCAHMTICAIILNASLTPRYLHHICSIISEKIPQARAYAIEWLGLILVIHHNEMKPFLNRLPTFGVFGYFDITGEKAVQMCIEKCLTDASPLVRAAARLVFWAFIDIWPHRKDPILNALDGSARKLLLEAQPFVETDFQESAMLGENERNSNNDRVSSKENGPQVSKESTVCLEPKNGLRNGGDLVNSTLNTSSVGDGHDLDHQSTHIIDENENNNQNPRKDSSLVSMLKETFQKTISLSLKRNRPLATSTPLHTDVSMPLSADARGNNGVLRRDSQELASEELPIPPQESRSKLCSRSENSLPMPEKEDNSLISQCQNCNSINDMLLSDDLAAKCCALEMILDLLSRKTSLSKLKESMYTPASENENYSPEAMHTAINSLLQAGLPNEHFEYVLRQYLTPSFLPFFAESVGYLTVLHVAICLLSQSGLLTLIDVLKSKFDLETVLDSILDLLSSSESSDTIFEKSSPAILYIAPRMENISERTREKTRLALQVAENCGNLNDDAREALKSLLRNSNQEDHNGQNDIFAQKAFVVPKQNVLAVELFSPQGRLQANPVAMPSSIHASYYPHATKTSMLNHATYPSSRKKCLSQSFKLLDKLEHRMVSQVDLMQFCVILSTGHEDRHSSTLVRLWPTSQQFADRVLQAAMKFSAICEERQLGMLVLLVAKVIETRDQYSTTSATQLVCWLADMVGKCSEPWLILRVIPHSRNMLLEEREVDYEDMAKRLRQLYLQASARCTRTFLLQTLEMLIEKVDTLPPDLIKTIFSATLDKDVCVRRFAYTSMIKIYRLRPAAFAIAENNMSPNQHRILQYLLTHSNRSM